MHMGHLPRTTQFAISNLEQSFFSVYIIDTGIKFHTQDENLILIESRNELVPELKSLGYHVNSPY